MTDRPAEAREIARKIRLDIRAGTITDQTSGMAPGFAQGNLVVLPKAWASDFLRFCLANPKPCPLLAVGEPGDPALPTVGNEIDIRRDVPRYRVFRDGQLIEEVTDISPYWADDYVSFLIGCSFSFEGALMDAGIGVRHIELGSNVPMYRTNIDCVSAGPFKGQFVVSMRPMRPADAIRAIEITSRMPQVTAPRCISATPRPSGFPTCPLPTSGTAFRSMMERFRYSGRAASPRRLRWHRQNRRSRLRIVPAICS